MRRIHYTSLVLILTTGISVAGEITGKVTCKGVRSNQGAVLFLQKVDGDFAPPADPVVMDQKGLKFEPNILPVTVGTTVNFINSDEVLHNVFSPDICANEFNLGTYPKGEMRSHTFNEEGCFSVLLCNVHPEMEAWILVLQNPYYAITDENGVYRIENVPPGKYTLVAWHKRLKNKKQIIEVKAEGTTTVGFTLTRR